MNLKITQAEDSIPTDEPFIYISWRVEFQGLLNVIFAIRSAISYCIEENIGRNIILSDAIPLSKKHSPLSENCIVDIRYYFDFPNVFKDRESKPVNIFFDHNNNFYNFILLNTQLGFIWSSVTTGTQFAKTFSENTKFPYTFYELQHLGSTEFLTIAKKHEYLVYLGWRGWSDSAVKLNYNLNLQQKAKEIVTNIRQQHTEFSVLHLRRGDMVENVRPDQYYCQVKEHSEPCKVVRILRDNVNPGCAVYIMTNGTSEYVEQIVSELNSEFFVFTKTTLKELDFIGKKDNYELFVIELCMAELADKIISNRNWENLFKNPNVIDVGPKLY